MTLLVSRSTSSGSRPVALAVVVAFHAGLVWVALDAVRPMLADPPIEPLQARVIDRVPHPAELPPPSSGVETTFAPRAAPDIPLPTPTWPAEESVSPGAAVDAAPRPWISSAEESARTVAPTPLSYRALRPADDFYPPASIRMAEEGVVIVRACVGPAGGLAGPPTVTQGSGKARLDEAALRWVREAVEFTPATVDGRPVEACKGFRVSFGLR